MSKKTKEKINDEDLEKLHQEFSQKLANKIYDSIEKMGETYEKKYEYDSAISIFNVMLSISANIAVELGISSQDFSEVSKDFWKNAHELLHSEEEGVSSYDKWLEPKTKNKKDLS